MQYSIVSFICFQDAAPTSFHQFVFLSISFVVVLTLNLNLSSSQCLCKGGREKQLTMSNHAFGFKADIALINKQHLLPLKHVFVFLRIKTLQTLDNNLLSFLIVTILLPPLQMCPKCNNTVSCFRVHVLGDSLLTSDRHGHPFLWSEELETHH